MIEPHNIAIRNITLLSGQIVLYSTKLTHLYLIHNLPMACTTSCVSPFPAYIRGIAIKLMEQIDARAPAHLYDQCNAVKTFCKH